MKDTEPNIVQQYNGYTIEVYENYRDDGITFKIIEILSTGKRKVRRTSNCGTPARSPKGFRCRDGFGNVLYNPFNNMDEALHKAQNYIDKHIVPWEVKHPAKSTVSEHQP